jgi:hypothetical protein
MSEHLHIDSLPIHEFFLLKFSLEIQLLNKAGKLLANPKSSNCNVFTKNLCSNMESLCKQFCNCHSKTAQYFEKCSNKNIKYQVFLLKFLFLIFFYIKTDYFDNDEFRMKVAHLASCKQREYSGCTKYTKSRQNYCDNIFLPFNLLFICDSQNVVSRRF